LMFQDEARFGRMVRIRRCGPRAAASSGGQWLRTEFQYVYGAVSPLEGELDWRIGPVMNTEQMGTFWLKSVPPTRRIHRHGRGRSQFAHRAGPGGAGNIRLHRLPGYSPELNPQEHLWDELREKEFPNRVFSDMVGVVRLWKRAATAGCGSRSGAISAHGPGC